MVNPISRRTFLAASAGAVLAACGNDKKDDISVDKKKESKELSIVLGNQPPIYLAGAEERVAFMVIEGESPKGDLDIEVGFAPANGDYGPGIKAVAHKEGIETRPYYVVKQTFATPGFYRLGINVEGGSAEAALQAVEADKIAMPVQGRAVPGVKTPTVKDPMGVNPICTRSPICPWHEVSFDAALAEKRPVAFYVGTPARCTTRTCGPVLDVLLGLRETFEPKVRFVHLEVYTTLTGSQTIPAVGELKIQNEPWLFLIGADGVLRDRIGGPLAKTEAEAALARLTA